MRTSENVSICLSLTHVAYLDNNKAALNDSVTSFGNEKCVVREEYDKFQKLDHKTRQIYTNTSSVTMNLLASLNSIKAKNNQVFGKTDKTKEDINGDLFFNLLNDEEEKERERDVNTNMNMNVNNVNNNGNNGSNGNNANNVSKVDNIGYLAEYKNGNKQLQ